MKNHVFRPLWVVLCLIVLLLIARNIFVPEGFGIHERGYMYGWYRNGNIEEWKEFKVKYQDSDYCKNCHPDKHDSIMMTAHALISCENCHGPAIEHPSNPPKLSINRSRDACLRCHSYLSYPTSLRSKIRGIDSAEHYTEIECSACHNPHKPSLEGLK